MRRSVRNFLRFFEAAGVDERAEGPDVSEGVQIVYVADDLTHSFRNYAGAGTFEGALVAERAITQLECRNPSGLIVHAATQIGVPIVAGEPYFFGASTVAQAMTGPAVSTQWFTVAAPLSEITQGTTSVFPTGVPVDISQSITPSGLFLRNGEFFFVFYRPTNAPSRFGIYYSELNRA